MTKDEMILKQLDRIEDKVDTAARESAQTRESLVALQERLRSVVEDVSEVTETGAKNASDISSLKVSRARVLGALGATGTAGGAVAAALQWLFGGQ